MQADPIPAVWREYIAKLEAELKKIEEKIRKTQDGEECGAQDGEPESTSATAGLE